MKFLNYFMDVIDSFDSISATKINDFILHCILFALSLHKIGCTSAI